MKLEATKEQLMELLIEQKKLDAKLGREMLDQSRKTKKPLFWMMVEKDLFKEEEMISFLSENLNIPTLNINSLRVPKDITKLVPKKIVEKYQIFPLAKLQSLMTVATSDPFELLYIDDLRELTKCEVVLVLAPPKMLTHAIESYYAESASMETLLEGIDEEEIEVVKQGEEKEKDSLGNIKAGAEDAPVVKMVNVILDEALRQRASDIHFEPYEKYFRVRYRIDGALKETLSHTREHYPSVVARTKIMSVLDITEKRLPQDGRFRARIGGREVDFRVSVLPTYHGEKIVLRVLDKSGVKSGLDKLGFSEKPTAIFAEAIKHPYGMILVTGPTGSGKTTSLYTILNTMNTPDKNIMTIEDPVEYQMEGITQTQVHSEVGLTFASGLRSLLRQSPDIVLVGEIRDTETADIGVKAALTGHLVFSTLHTNSAAGAMTRLIDMGVEPFLIASSIICVAAQRLMRKICQYCKAPVQITDDMMRRCNMKKSDFQDFVPQKGAGCAKCNGTGYYGRLGTIEVLKMDPDIRELVIQKKSSDVIAKVAIEKGMETLFHNAFGLFKKGMTTMDEVLRVSSQE